MRYIPHTAADIEHLRKTIGVPSVDDLFEQIPENFRLAAPLDLPPALDELGLVRHMEDLADQNRPAGAPGGQRALSFLGAGTHQHHIPAAVDELLRRSEFSTAYTPYQGEISQGTLQAIFEFQTLVCNLLRMDIANASVYDGSTAMTEAILMARRVTRRDRVIISRTVHPEYREVAETYFRPNPDHLVEIPSSDKGVTSEDWVSRRVDNTTAAVVVQYPNFFGCLEPLDKLAALAHAVGALLVVTFTEALAFALVKPPGSFDADIAAGEGQSLGIPMGFGGPHLGMFASRGQFVRAMPGRLVGKTVDSEGRDGFVLTLSTREQHIRREKATSNICTNEGLCALAATIYMSLLGPAGLKKLALLNHINADKARKRISKAKGFSTWFSGTPTFNEFVIKTPRPAADIVAELADEGVAPGLDLGRFYPEMENALLVNVTEMHSPSDVGTLVDKLTG